MEYQPQLPWEEGRALGRIAPSSDPAPVASEGSARAGNRLARSGAGTTKADRASQARQAPPGEAGSRAGRAAAKGRARTRGNRTRGATATPTPARAYVVEEAWRLDESTRRAGRRGLAKARAALARAAARDAAGGGHAA